MKYAISFGLIKGSSPNITTNLENFISFTASNDLLVPEECFCNDLKKSTLLNLFAILLTLSSGLTIIIFENTLLRVFLNRHNLISLNVALVKLF